METEFKLFSQKLQKIEKIKSQILNSNKDFEHKFKSLLKINYIEHSIIK
jgi:hypothetical protein